MGGRELGEGRRCFRVHATVASGQFLTIGAPVIFLDSIDM